MGDRPAAERACKDPNPIIDGRKANVNLAILGAKPRGNVQPGNPICLFWKFILVLCQTKNVAVWCNDCAAGAADDFFSFLVIARWTLSTSFFLFQIVVISILRGRHFLIFQNAFYSYLCSLDSSFETVTYFWKIIRKTSSELCPLRRKAIYLFTFLLFFFLTPTPLCWGFLNYLKISDRKSQFETWKLI